MSAVNVDPILSVVRERGDDGLLELREKHDAIERSAPLWIERDALVEARDALDAETRTLLERTAERIRRFATAQRACLSDLDTEVEGGRAGHAFAPVDSAGCYAPGGRYPLVSSVLMTAVTAVAAGVTRVCVATPSTLPLMRAAAGIAGAHAMLACGGAHAIGALAYGTETVSSVDVVVGPGNAWVTAAKERVSGRVGIDMLAGPSELVVVASDEARPELVAADLLAQAEHDPDARVVLLTRSQAQLDRVRDAVSQLLLELPTRAIAEASWAMARTVTCADDAEVIDICNEIAPEHLHLNMPADEARKLAAGMRHYGALFIGEPSAEVFGDYGVGPNHVLPTAGSSRFRGGLSVLTFLRMRTWLELTGDPTVIQDATALADLEGLAAHGRSAAMRGV